MSAPGHLPARPNRTPRSGQRCNAALVFWLARARRLEMLPQTELGNRVFASCGEDSNGAQSCYPVSRFSYLIAIPPILPTLVGAGGAFSLTFNLGSEEAPCVNCAALSEFSS